ncbi:MAG: hypothetical protein IJ447_08675 [Clostridia bacterium]|nr:hypothetical protein [Clostridia bacterium]
MKVMKKVFAVFMALCMLLVPLVISANAAGRKPALRTSAGIQALRDEFDHDVAPKAGGHALDYAYYSPVGVNDNTKYPLVIFLHGIGHADYEGAQLNDSDFPYWASAELQSRFDEGGAFILLPRAPEDKLIYWGETLIESLRSVIDDVIAKHGDNIDTTKIFIGGSSAGGEMTWKMIIAFPEYFAGAFPIASTGTVSETDTLVCSDVAIWMIASKKDPIVNYTTITTPLWNNVVKHNSNPEKCRLSSFENVVEPAGASASDNHHMAKVVTYDFHMLDGSTYPNVTTKDGNGNTVSLVSPNGMIKWMNSLSSSYEGNAADGSGNVNVSVFDSIFGVLRNFVLKLVNIVQRILGL